MNDPKIFQNHELHRKPMTTEGEISSYAVLSPENTYLKTANPRKDRRKHDQGPSDIRYSSNLSSSNLSHNRKSQFCFPIKKKKKHT